MDMILEKLLGWFRIYGPRLIAGWVATLAVYLETKYQIVLDADTKAALVAGAVGVFGTVYPIFHKLLSKWINPGDAASNTLAVVEKNQVQVAKTIAKNTEDAARTNYPE